jgi:hypothetical protein
MRARLNCLEQYRSIKNIEARERPQIEVVLHSAIQHPKRCQRFQLLGDNCLFRIGPQDRSREFQKRGIFDFNDAWGNHIAEADVDLHRDPSTSKSCPEANTHALIVRVLFDPSDLQRLRIVFDT